MGTLTTLWGPPILVNSLCCSPKFSRSAWGPSVDRFLSPLFPKADYRLPVLCSLSVNLSVAVRRVLGCALRQEGWACLHCTEQCVLRGVEAPALQTTQSE